MNEDKFFEYYAKKEMLKKEISLYNSKYYNFTHKIQISGAQKSDKLISLLHESIHWYLNNLSLCTLSVDFANLFNFLKYFYEQKKEEIFLQKSELKYIKNEIEKIKYIMSYTEELDKILADDDKLVNFCKFCVNVFDIYLELTNANEFINEGLATYYSLNATKNCPIFTYDDIPNIFDLAIQNNISHQEISEKQTELKNKILLDKNNEDLYKLSYKYTKYLHDIYGDDCLLLVLVPIISSEFKIYEFNLLNYSTNEIKKIINNKYSYDTMYLNLMNKADDILSILFSEKLDSFVFKKLYNIITNFSKPYEKISKIELYHTLNAFFFKHPNVINAIENLLGRKMSDNEFKKAYTYSSFQRIGKELFSFYEHDEIKFKDINDLEELILGYAFNYQKIANKNDLYAEKNFLSTYCGMKKIIYNSKGE